MYKNSTIQWHSGMELTSQVFHNLEQDLTTRQKITIRAAIADGSIGILPGTDVYVDGAFVRRTFEITGLRLTCLTLSGTILSVDDDLSIEIPKLEGEEYFLCVGISANEKHEFERDGILYEAPKYELSIIDASDEKTLQGDVFPIKHLLIKEGRLQVDADYIMPVLSLASETRFDDYRIKYLKHLSELTLHQNMDEGDCKRSLQNMLFRLHALEMNRHVTAFIDLLQELALTVRYYVVGQLGNALEECPELPKTLDSDSRQIPSQYNIADYLKWLDEYLAAQKEILDKTVIVDNSIDYDKLKKELHDEIYQQVHDDLYEKMRVELHDSLSQELTDKIMVAVRELVNDHLHPELHDKLMDELHDPMYNDLYEKLHAILYDELYQPIHDNQEIFTPLI